MGKQKEIGEINKVDESKKRTTSPSYTVKAFAANIRKLNELNMLESDDYESLKSMHKKIVERFIGLNMFE